MSKREGIQSIAVINFGGIGDELLFSPVLVALKHCFPNAKTTLFLEKRSQAVLPLLPGVDAAETLTIIGKNKFSAAWELLSALRAGRFDLVVSSGSNPLIAVLLWLSGIPYRFGFHSGALSQKLLSRSAPLLKQRYAGEMYFSLAKAVSDEFHCPLPESLSEGLPQLETLPETSLTEPLSWLNQASDLPLVLLHPGVSRVSVEKNIFKTWPAKSWADCIQHLTAFSQVVLVGGPDDTEIVSDIVAALPSKVQNFQNLYGKTKNLIDLAALIQASSLLLSVDSSPLHLAIGLKKPVVVVFGPTDEKKLMPNPEKYPQYVSVIRAELSCRPCLWDVRQTNCETSDCLNVPVPLVVHAVRQTLSTFPAVKC